MLIYIMLLIIIHLVNAEVILFRIRQFMPIIIGKIKVVYWPRLQ